MSTLYGIPKKIKGNNIEYNEDNVFIIGRTYGFTEDGEIIQKFLIDDTPIVSIGNISKIKNIKQLREYYDKID